MENNSAQRSSHIAQYAKDHPDFITVTCLEWKPVLQDDRLKEIIISSLSFLSRANRVTVYAFVIMDNHFHLIWQIMNEHTREAVQRDFLRYTSQQILKVLRNEQSPHAFVGVPHQQTTPATRTKFTVTLKYRNVTQPGNK